MRACVCVCVCVVVYTRFTFIEWVLVWCSSSSLAVSNAEVKGRLLKVRGKQGVCHWLECFGCTVIGAKK